MFYGNAFEAFATLAEVLVVLNNLQQGRAFNEFQILTFEKYRALDKGSKLGPIAMNGPFLAFCEEFDNGLRNASHHGRLSFDPEAQTVSYRGSKGGQGAMVSLSYADYLRRSVTLFFQIVALFQMEIVFHHSLNVRAPILRT
jgi:hypothetical protein